MGKIFTDAQLHELRAAVAYYEAVIEDDEEDNPRRMAQRKAVLDRAWGALVAANRRRTPPAG